ncbi:MAG: 2-phosphosulfolactate phosphatase [Cyclonatronaceae bacterium]
MKKEIDVFASSISFTEQDVRDKTVVVIDVLRACSTIQTALENGANGIIPVAENDDASRYMRVLDTTAVLLCGEKGGQKIQGYRLGNSPLEFTRETVKNKTIIFKTSNGTRAITRSLSAGNLFIASFLNLSAVVETLAAKDPAEVLLVCSGWNSRLSIEDMLCAGAITHRLFGGTLPADAYDGVKMAFGLYEMYGNDIPGLVHLSNHAKRLRDMGFEEDVAYCGQVDLYDSVPGIKDGLISIR